MIFYETIAKGYVPPANYYKAELLELLNINSDSWQKMFKTARNTETSLQLELNKTGYKKTQKRLTKLQCKIIFEFLGYPDLSEKNKTMLLQQKYISQKDIDNADEYIK